jgi:hypothetical protein
MDLSSLDPMLTFADDVELRKRLMLPRALGAVSPTLTTSVQPGQGLGSSSSIDAYRKRATDLYQQGSDLYNKEPDMTELQAFAKQRGEQGSASMLNALAAQFAGESFQPIQAQYLKKAAAAMEPMKVGSGMLTADGKYLKDPFAGQEKKAEFLLQQAKAYETLAQTAQTAQEKAEALRLQNLASNELKQLMAQIAAMNAQTGRITANAAMLNATGGGSGVGVGTASQIGSGANEEPIFRTKNGQLFTYDQTGKPISYAGPINPKATSAQPTEDERKAAGWFFQADNARRNMANIVATTPSAAYPTGAERFAGLVPSIGEDIANYLRPEQRQMFVQASGSMAEALLRAATGAGVNESEAAQKVRELVPQLGDKPGTVKQKTDAYDVYMNSLRSRAGRALPKTPAPSGGGNVVDFNNLPK